MTFRRGEQRPPSARPTQDGPRTSSSDSKRSAERLPQYTTTTVDVRARAAAIPPTRAKRAPKANRREQQQREQSERQHHRQRVRRQGCLRTEHIRQREQSERPKRIEESNNNASKASANTPTQHAPPTAKKFADEAASVPNTKRSAERLPQYTTTTVDVRARAAAIPPTRAKRAPKANRREQQQREQSERQHHRQRVRRRGCLHTVRTEHIRQRERSERPRRIEESNNNASKASANSPTQHAPPTAKKFADEAASVPNTSAYVFLDALRSLGLRMNFSGTSSNGRCSRNRFSRYRM